MPLRSAVKTAVLAVLAVLAVPAAPAAAQTLLGQPVLEFRVESDVPVNEEDLRELIPIKIGEPLTAEGLARSDELLAQKGVFWWSRTDTETLPGGAGVVLRLGRKPVVRRVKVDGYDHLTANEVRQLVRITAGTIFDQTVADAAAERLTKRYRQIGFPQAQVEVEAVFEEGEVDVELAIDEGRPETIERAELEGAPVSVSQALARRLRRLAGDRKTRELVRDMEKRVRRELRDGGYYESRVKTEWVNTNELDGVLRFVVRAGPRFHILVQGNESVWDSTLLGLVDLRDRLIITDGTWRELARRMTQYYNEKGYYQAVVDLKMDGEVEKTARYVITEGPRFRVRKVTFEGNSGVSSDDLAAEMLTRPPRPIVINWIPSLRAGSLVDEAFDDDLRRLWFFYRERGYESAQIIDARRVVDPEAGSITLEIVIEEGPPTIVREVRTEGLDELPPGSVGWKTIVGRTLRPKRLQQDEIAITSTFAKGGYSDVKVETVVEREPGPEQVDAVVTFKATYGEKRKIRQVLVRGNIDTRDRVLIREMPFKAGDPIDPDQLVKGQVSAYQLGLFRSVNIEAVGPIEDGKQDVAVSVIERPAGKFEWGGGYNTRDGFGTFGELSYDNLWGLARRVSARGQISLDPGEFTPNQYLASLGYRDQHFLESKWQINATVLGERATRKIEPFAIERETFAVETNRALTTRIRGGLQMQIEHAYVFDVEEDAALTDRDSGTLYTVAPGVLVVYDGRDDPVAPQKGIFESASFRWGLPEASTVHFGRLTLQHTHYIPLPGGLTFVYGARGGWAPSFDDDPIVPIRERLFLGGRTTVRGFAENQVGPRKFDGAENTTGGDISLNINTELRIPLPIIANLQFATFLDGGGVYISDNATRAETNQDAHTVIKDFRRSTGLGLRYLTPVGPISLDYGIKLDRRSDESFGEVHFSIGASF